MTAAQDGTRSSLGVSGGVGVFPHGWCLVLGKPQSSCTGSPTDTHHSGLSSSSQEMVDHSAARRGPVLQH